MAARPALHGMADIRAFFRTNGTPIYFVSPTAFNLLGLDRWVRDFFYVTYFDSFQGHHPRVFVPDERPPREFTSIEDVCNYLLGHKEVVDFVDARGPGGKATFVMFDEETERRRVGDRPRDHPPAGGAAEAARLEDRDHPDRQRRRRSQRAQRARPRRDLRRARCRSRTAAGWAAIWSCRRPTATPARRRSSSARQADWDSYASDLHDQELKVMRRITPLEVCVEAVITRNGTLVGPYVASLIGHPELTPYKGGWCGNDIFPEVLTDSQRTVAGAMTQRLGARLAKEGYSGFFEVDYLLDADSGEIYLGEINPRVSGLSPITHVTLGAYSDMPLFLFHLLEYLDVDYEIDVAEINARWERLAAEDVWSQLIIKETEPGDRAADGHAAHRDLGTRPRRPADVQAAGQRLACVAQRGRGVLPARRVARRVPLQGRRPGRAGDARADADRRPAAHRPLPALALAPCARGSPGRPRRRSTTTRRRWRSRARELAARHAGARAARPAGAHAGAGRSAAGDPVHVRRDRRGSAGGRVPGAVRRVVGRLPRVVPAGRRRGPPELRRVPGGDPHAHAGAAGDLRAGGGAGRRGRPGGAHALAVVPAVVPVGLHAGGAVPAGPGARPQLRLRPAPHRGRPSSARATPAAA